ncbi:MAG: hypothetical protein B7L53_03220 [Thermofilum sp. NZ13]|nr:MAG: hypothetical protein B7L53_03220 [Thermofilum sp. NZ13]
MLVAAILLQYMRSQTELQAIATQTQSQRVGEGVLSLSIADTYSNATSTPPLVNVLVGRCTQTGNLSTLDGRGLVFTPNSTANGYVLQVNFTTTVPTNTVDVTQSLYLNPSITLNAQVYTKTPEGVYTLSATYLLPASTTSAITVHSPSYILSMQASRNFTVLLDQATTNLTMYNTTGFYLYAKNQGPGYTAIHGLWVITNTSATRIPLSITLPPGGAAQIPVGINSTAIKELRAIAITRVYIIHPNSPKLAASLAYTAGGASGQQQPHFTILSYNSTIAGTVSSKQVLVVTVSNTGQVAGTARVEVYDQNGNLVNATQLSVSPASPKTATLTVTLPPTRGTYTWTLKVKNLATGSYDDSKTITVIARDLLLQSRGAVIYEDFESMPSGWTPLGGTWAIVPGGWRGNALRGTDNDGGPGGDSVFANNTRISATIQAIVKLGNVQRNDRVYRGVVLLEQLTNSTQLYELSLEPQGNNIWLNALLYESLPQGRSWVTTWVTLNDTITGYVSSWYTLYVKFTKGSPNTMSLVLYDQNGNTMATLSAKDTTISPNYIGLATDGGTTLFDDFVVTSGADPRYVVVSGLQAGWRVQLLDSSMSLCAQAAADATGMARLSVINCSILRNATMRVLDQSGNTVIQKTLPAVVGGDTYTYG